MPCVRQFIEFFVTDEEAVLQRLRDMGLGMTNLNFEKRGVWMLLVLAFIAFFTLESIAIHHFYSARFPGVGDF